MSLFANVLIQTDIFTKCKKIEIVSEMLFYESRWRSWRIILNMKYFS